MEQLAEDDYGSDDDLGDSELAQAEKMQTQLLARLANTDEELNRKWLEADQQDYELRGTVLDQDVITRRLELLKTFAEHLRNVGRNRASLLARLAEPLAEEHWMLDPEYHQRMVDALQNMCALINRLPDISAAARHCTAGLSVLPDSTDAAETGSDDSTRDIARMERLAHEVEQAAEWLQAENRSSAPLPKLTS
ncbi:hypothetical protein H4S01_004739 [Coemansia sp. RSA 2610]|nr:hypothetical protein H4S01_004739 [Coemansia sp. RSA 2610]